MRVAVGVVFEWNNRLLLWNVQQKVMPYEATFFGW